MRMEKKIINLNPQTNYFSETKPVSLLLAFISENTESLGLLQGPFPLSPQETTTAITIAFGEPDSPAWWKIVTITWLLPPALFHFIYIKGTMLVCWGVQLVVPKTTRIGQCATKAGLESVLFCSSLMAWILLFMAHILSNYVTIYQCYLLVIYPFIFWTYCLSPYETVSTKKMGLGLLCSLL